MGVTESMFNLASLLTKGCDLVSIDRPRAVNLLEEASKKGDVDAMFELAQLLTCTHSGIPTGSKYSINLHERTIIKEDSLPPFQVHGDDSLQSDVQRAVKLYQNAISKGHTGAMVQLASNIKLDEKV